MAFFITGLTPQEKEVKNINGNHDYGISPHFNNNIRGKNNEKEQKENITKKEETGKET